MPNNGSLSKGTWRKYGYTNSKVAKVSKAFGVDMSFPFTQMNTLMFICYYIQKGLLTTTIESYLSGVR